eukprot:COSAG01_NODE_582_length_15201_cov_7.218315_8_plen_70_part_00
MKETLDTYELNPGSTATEMPLHSAADTASLLLMVIYCPPTASCMHVRVGSLEQAGASKQKQTPPLGDPV